jgi:hypothetical protein
MPLAMIDESDIFATAKLTLTAARWLVHSTIERPQRSPGPSKLDQ